MNSRDRDLEIDTGRDWRRLSSGCVGVALAIVAGMSPQRAVAGRDHTFHIIASIPSLCAVDGSFLRMPRGIADGVAIGGPSALIDRYRIRCNVPYTADVHAPREPTARRHRLVLLVTANF